MSPYIVGAVFATVLSLASAQVPGFGGCPDFVAQSDFDMSRFLGTWFEAERYINIFEAGTRCVKTNYSKAPDGRYLVANEITATFTGVKRVMEGEIRLIVKGAESKLHVRYPNLPLPYDTQYTVLETDYDDYAVLWSCSSLGLVNTQNAWVLTRQKLPSGTTLQKAYGVLDKFKLSRSFFLKTNQEACDLAETVKTEQAAKEGDNSVREPEVLAAASSQESVKVPAPGHVHATPASPAPLAAAPVAGSGPHHTAVAPQHDHHKEHKEHHKEKHEHKENKPVSDSAHHSYHPSQSPHHHHQQQQQYQGHKEHGVFTQSVAKH